jgi:hypothetical protein
MGGVPSKGGTWEIQATDDAGNPIGEPIIGWDDGEPSPTFEGDVIDGIGKGGEAVIDWAGDIIDDIIDLPGRAIDAAGDIIDASGVLAQGAGDLFSSPILLVGGAALLVVLLVK